MSSPPSEAGRHASAPIVDVIVPEEPPAFLCNVIATVISFVLVMLLDFFSSNYPLLLLSALEPAWGLLQDLLPYGPLVDGAVGAAVLTVLAVALQLVQTYRPFPGWLPLVLVWPAALAVVAPSALEHDEWTPWLILGALAAGLFCFHWLCVLLAREAWD
jgi:ABC-type multidrug transport system permease subunit